HWFAIRISPVAARPVLPLKCATSEFHRQTDGELVIVLSGSAEGLYFIVARLRKRHRKLPVAGVALATGTVPASDFEFSVRGRSFVHKLISWGEALPVRPAVGLFDQEQPINAAAFFFTGSEVNRTVGAGSSIGLEHDFLVDVTAGVVRVSITDSFWFQVPL